MPEERPSTALSASSPAGPVIGIFSLFFREAGALMADTFDRLDYAVRDLQGDVQSRAKAREERLRIDSQTRLLEEMRRAKEAGLDPEAILRRYQGLPEPSTPTRR